MKLGRSKSEVIKATKPDKNSGTRTIALVAVLAITAVLILWVYSMGKKAEQTVAVTMILGDMYKNQQVTEENLVQYDMLAGEFEKYAVADDSGQAQRRIILWDERDQILGAFAAYPLQDSKVAMWEDFMKSRVDNSDSVMYSYPGKNLITLNIGSDTLSSFKTFLQPGDRVNITAVFTREIETVTKNEETGEEVKETKKTVMEEPLFEDILLADMLNGQGKSILDMMAMYRDLTTFQQAAYDDDEEWQDAIQADSIIVALTPEEEARYYEYIGKDDIAFYMSIPQRVQ